jgi:hypothetical protein
VTKRRSAQTMHRRDARDEKDLASHREVDDGLIGIPHVVVAVVDAATGVPHVAVVVRVRAAKSGVVVVVGEIRWVDLRNEAPLVVASIPQRLPRRLQRGDGGRRRRDARQLVAPRSTIHRGAFVLGYRLRYSRCYHPAVVDASPARREPRGSGSKWRREVHPVRDMVGWGVDFSWSCCYCYWEEVCAAAVGFVVVRIELFLALEAPELAQCTAVVGLEGDGGDDDPLPRCSCWSLLQQMHSQREVQ